MWIGPHGVFGWQARGALVLALGIAVLFLRPYPAERLAPRGVVSTRIVDRNGALLYEARSARGGYTRWVSLDQISPALVAATLSSEDAQFRDHLGVDPVGVARAIWLNARERRFAYGGSTITQQLAKMLDPQPRTLLGKLREASDAFRLERTLSKDEILEQYLNRAYYGRQAYGAEAAANRFFGKPAAELELDEAALLAVLPRGPTAYDPSRFPERAKRRREHILTQLVDRRWIDAETAQRAAERPIRLVRAKSELRARHALDVIGVGAGAGKPEVVTTLDLGLQERIEGRVREQLRDVAGNNADQAAVVVIENATGEVLAMVGSRDYSEQAVLGANNGAIARRPPGSTLKPFVYALSIQAGAHPSTPTFDVPTAWRDFRPRNVSQTHLGRVSLRDALGNSLNIPAVRAANDVGVNRVAALLEQLDLLPRDSGPHDLSLALGSAPMRLVDLTNAYATLARGGAHLPWRLVDPGPSKEPATQVLDSAAAHLVTDVLADAQARRRQFGVETPLDLPFPAAAKTGTSKSFCDNVVVGYTPEVTVGVWLGNFDGRPMHGVLAMRGAAPLWRDAMRAAMHERPRRDFVPPPSVTSADVCPLSGMQRGTHCPSGRTERVSKAHLPHAACTWHGPGGALALPAEIARHDVPALASPGASIEIHSPQPGAVLAIDPLLPRTRQALRLGALVRDPAVTRVRWEIDGRSVGESSAPYGAHWLVEPGRHRLRAIALAGTQQLATHEIEFEVEGPRHDP